MPMHPAQKNPVWNDFRRWMSNIAPLVVCAPVPAIAYYLDVLGYGREALIAWISFPVICYLAINFLGLVQNRKMRTELEYLLGSANLENGRRVFVGFSRPKAKVGIHPHEDLGWLVIKPDALEFIGERWNYVLERSEIRRIGFGFNVNSFFGLGRWIRIDGEVGGKFVRMLVEPRERDTMLGNLLLGGRLVRELRSWLKLGR